MIKPNELRIGNLVVGSHSDRPLSTIIHQVTGFDLYGRRTDFFAPIPLTPEILEKCGFKIESFYSDNDYSVYIDHNSELFLELDWRRRDEGFDPKVLDEELRSIGINIKYLYQLQNLYFALTGEELKINLNVEAHQ